MRCVFRERLGCVLVLGTLLAGPLAAEDWSRFRGPNGSGVAESKGLPVEFGPEQNLDWAVEVPFGRSSPAVAGDRVFLTATEDGRLVTLAVDRSSGEILWRQSLERSADADLYSGNDSATPTPVTDGSSVFVLFHEAGVVSFDAADGKERWRHTLGPFRNYYGISGSPILAGDKLVVVCDQAIGSYVLALDKTTGKLLWRAERPGRRESYATPILYPDTGAPREVLVYGSRWVDAHDVETGDVVWSLGGLSAGPVASPVLVDGWLFVSGQDHAPEGLGAFSEVAEKHDADRDGCLTGPELEGTWMAEHLGWLDVDGSGCISAQDWALIDQEIGPDEWGAFAIQLEGPEGQPRIVWSYRRNVAYIPSPIVVDGVFYMVRDSIVSSLDARTGELHKRARLARGSMKVYASPVAAEGRLYFATVEGQVAVVKAAPEWEVLALNELGDEIYATPAMADGHLLVRTRTRLFSFSAKESAGSGAPAGEEETEAAVDHAVAR